MADGIPARLYDLELCALEQLIGGWGFERRLASDLWRSLYRGCVSSLDQVPGLDGDLRDRIAAAAPLYVPEVSRSEEAPNGDARKELLTMEDGHLVEVVQLRYRTRWSACVSTQVGCACRCPYCATGRAGFVRDLSSGEIVAQVLHVQRALRSQGESLSNVVIMGMGEPLLNYDQTLAAIRTLGDPHGVGLVQRRITLSTVGIAPSIRQLARERFRGAPLQVKLAVSIHAATDALRDSLVPVNCQYPLGELFDAMREYVDLTQRRVMLEWVMIDGVNDSVDQAHALVKRMGGLRAHVNLIRLNEIEGYTGRASGPAAINAFAGVLDSARVPHTLRQRRGETISAGCGQLRWRRIGRS